MKQITITVPDNCELKQDGNTYTIVEKEKKVTYEDVARELFSKSYHYIDSSGKIHNEHTDDYHITEPNNYTSQKQAEKLLAINKLMNIAKWVNDGWQPDWNDWAQSKYYIYYSNSSNTLTIDGEIIKQRNFVYFKSKKLAEKAIEILGEETIKIALCADY